MWISVCRTGKSASDRFSIYARRARITPLPALPPDQPNTRDPYDGHPPPPLAEKCLRAFFRTKSMAKIHGENNKIILRYAVYVTSVAAAVSAVRYWATRQSRQRVEPITTDVRPCVNHSAAHCFRRRRGRADGGRQTVPARCAGPLRRPVTRRAVGRVLHEDARRAVSPVPRPGYVPSSP